MVALMMVVLIGMAAFAIDVSSWYSDQQHLQMQADAAVLAGANQLAAGLTNCDSLSNSVKDTANDYSDASGAPSPITSNGEARRTLFAPQAAHTSKTPSRTTIRPRFSRASSGSSQRSRHTPG
jgi:uncharacterized membrane protein